MKTLLLMSFAIFLSACRGGLPEAPTIQRCIINLETNREICNDYKFDVLGGYTFPDTEVRREITDRSILIPLEDWLKMSTWRDEVVEWAQDKDCK